MKSNGLNEMFLKDRATAEDKWVWSSVEDYEQTFPTKDPLYELFFAEEAIKP